jgi:hypothetical protein
VGDQVERPRLWELLVATPAAAAGVALAALLPGTASFWLAPLLVAPFFIIAATRHLSPWDDVPPRRRHVAAVLSAALAVAGALWVLVAPDDRSYLLGGLMTLPLLAVLYARSENDPRREMPSTGDPAADLPLFD